MLKVQSMLPLPEPVESFNAVASAVSRSALVAAGTKSGSPDQTAEVKATLTEWVSLRSTSAKLRLPVAVSGGRRARA